MSDTLDEPYPPVEVEDLPPPVHRRRRRRGRTLLMALVVILVAGLLLGGVGVVWARRQINPGGHRGDPVSLIIPPGSSTTRIASILGSAHVIRAPRVFRYYVRLKGAGPFQAGTYQLPTNDTYDDVIRVLSKGPPVTVAFDRLTIPEGFTLHQIADRVGRLPGRSAQKFLDAAATGQVRSRLEPASSNNLEGLLQADTYFVQPEDDEVTILRRMVNAFDTTTTDAGVDQAAVRLNVTPYQVVIVASMIEREAKLAEDRGPIASVIYNRLRLGMALGIDATLSYGLGKSTLTKSDLASKNPYNTRLVQGLPPTPIASPGKPSLAAATNPPTTKFLYYVLTDAGGKHSFADNPTDFAKLLAQARKKGLI